MSAQHGYPMIIHVTHFRRMPPNFERPKQAGLRRHMSSSPPPETGGAYIFDASTFLKGLRSISLRNLSLR